jgi:GntR family transcriptional regulator / MocR family aminotransferase
MGTVVVVDRASATPLTRQIYEFWRAGILSGRFAGGERVPSSRDVALALDLARGTITQAYEQLISEGYFETSRGAGDVRLSPVAREAVECTGHCRAASGA